MSLLFVENTNTHQQKTAEANYPLTSHVLYYEVKLRNRISLSFVHRANILCMFSSMVLSQVPILTYLCDIKHLHPIKGALMINKTPMNRRNPD